MLEIEGIDVFYGPVQAVRGLNLTVGEGEMVALLGANGAGKTTTLRTISGLLAPRQGSIWLDGEDISGYSPQEIVRMGVAQLPEGRELFAELSVVENLRLGHWSRRKERKRYEERLEAMLALFPRLRERASQAAGTLSGGEQQMLAVARALMSEPRLLLVDELSLGLAPIIVSQLFEAIREVNARDTAVLLVEQFVTLALRNTSRAYVLAKGEVAAKGASSELLASPDVLAAYLGIEADGGADPSHNGGKKEPRIGAAELEHAASGPATSKDPSEKQVDGG
jgi:branched-chain amino acid transport system ATP-binding protein